MISSGVLQKAKATLLEVGWGKGDGETIDATPPKCCVTTAIARHTQPPIPSKDFDDAVFLFVTANPHIRKPLSEWNDERSRRLEDILSAFDAAIALAERIEARRPVTN